MLWPRAFFQGQIVVRHELDAWSTPSWEITGQLSWWHVGWRRIRFLKLLVELQDSVGVLGRYVFLLCGLSEGHLGS